MAILAGDLRKARKRYRCDDCGQPIESGDSYYNYRGVYEGMWWGQRICVICRLEDQFS